MVEGGGMGGGGGGEGVGMTILCQPFPAMLLLKIVQRQKFWPTHTKIVGST